MFYADDPRNRWRPIASPTSADLAIQRALPPGARLAPLEWAWTTRKEEHVQFDRDEQTEHTVTTEVVTGWRPSPDPRLRCAGTLSLWSVETVEPGVLARFPSARAWPGPSVFVARSNHLSPGDLAHIGAARRWRGLSLWETRTTLSTAMLSEIAESFPALRWLDLHVRRPAPESLDALAAAPFLPALDDLTLNSSGLDDGAARGLIERLGAPRIVDLRGAGLSATTIHALLPKLQRVRTLDLSESALGDEGLTALLQTGALARVVELSLDHCGLTDASARALVAARLPALRGLWLTGNQLSVEGLTSLVRSPLFERLLGAGLSQRGLRPAGLLPSDHPLFACLSGTAVRSPYRRLRFLGQRA